MYFLPLKVFYNIGKVKADSGQAEKGEIAYREAIRYVAILQVWLTRSIPIVSPMHLQTGAHPPL